MGMQLPRSKLLHIHIAGALAVLHVGCASAVPVAAKHGEAQKRPPASIFVHESSGRSLAAWPISGGFPFAQGTVRDSDKLRLTAAGQPLPVQSRVLSHWPDGSVRWVLLDWQADLKATQTAEFHVDSAAAPAPVRSVRVQESKAGVDVDSGPLRFRIPKTSAALIEDIKLNGRPATSGPVTCFLSIDGKRNPCQAPTSVRVIDAGPLRARIEIRGAYADRFVYVVRVDAYAGQPFVRVFHTFEQHSTEPYVNVQQIAIEIPVATATTYRFGVEDGKPIAGSVPAAGVTLVQPDNLGFVVDGKAFAGHAAGWAALQGAEQGLAIAARYFWQEYPKSIELRRDRVTYNLWAAPAAAVTPAKIGSGAAKTHELALYFSEKEPEATLIEALRSPSLPYANPAWTAHTQALRNALAPDAGAKTFLQQLDDGYRRQAAFASRERWDDSGSATCAPPQPERPRSGFFGMFNWGDWNYAGYHDTTKGCDAWGNLEYDKTQVLALAFAATGKAPYADDMVASARHFMDVDTIHFCVQRPQWVGMNHPKNPLHFTFELGGIDLGHTWIEGLLSYYVLSGDERALTAARGIADYLVTRIRRGNVKGNPRQWGWPQIALVAMYEASGEDVYRQAALAYARGGMAAHPPDRIRDWKLGILAESLAYTDSVTTDAQIRDWLSRYAAAVTAYSAAADRRFMPALAYVGRVSHKPEYTKAALDSAQHLVFGNWAKPFTIAGRVGFSVLGASGQKEQ